MLDKGSEALEANLPQGSISDGTIRHWVHSLSWAADRLPSTMRSLPVSKFKGKYRLILHSREFRNETTYMSAYNSMVGNINYKVMKF